MQGWIQDFEIGWQKKMAAQIFGFPKYVYLLAVENLLIVCVCVCGRRRGGGFMQFFVVGGGRRGYHLIFTKCASTEKRAVLHYGALSYLIISHLHAIMVKVVCATCSFPRIMSRNAARLALI